LGGGVAGAGDLLLATVRQTIYRRSLPLATRDLTVRRSALDDRAGVIGAATMAANELFAPAFLPRWLGAGTPAGHA
jgi:predicted NBD/HSP70 family sugar kinase